MNVLYGLGSSVARLLAPDADESPVSPAVAMVAARSSPAPAARAPVAAAAGGGVAPALAVPAEPPAPLLALGETINEVLLHLADGRYEMAVLMLTQAGADLGRFEMAAAPTATAEEQRAVATMREVYAASEARVKADVKAALLTAVFGHKGGDIARCCKLLCMLQQADEAYATLLEKHLLHSLAVAIGNVERDILREVDRSKPGFYIAGATHVFQLMLDLVSDHEGLLIKEFGVLRFFDALQALQQRVDAFAGTLFGAFTSRRVQPMVASVEVAALGALSALLDEMARLSLRCEIFSQGVDEAAHRALDYAVTTKQSSAESEVACKRLTAQLGHSHVRRGNLEAMSSYVLLEQRTIGRSLDLTKLNQFVDVDAFFFVLDRSAQRALTGCNVTIACSIVSAVATHVELELLQWLREAWAGPAATDSALLRDILHRVALCCTMAPQLSSRLGTVATKYFRDQAALDKIGSCLGLLRSAAAELEREGQSMARRHVAMLLEPLQQTVDALDGTRDGASLAAQLTRSLDAGLNGGAEAWLLGSAATRVAELLDGKLATLRFSQVQALQFQALVQAVCGALQERGCPVEGAFARLRLCCVLLCVDSVADVPELWSPQWPLAVSEVRQLLARRRDFAAADIARLRLAK